MDIVYLYECAVSAAHITARIFKRFYIEITKDISYHHYHYYSRQL